jgi:hypothetical protein
MGIKLSSLLELLAHLNIAYPVDEMDFARYDDDTIDFVTKFVFFPWYVTNKLSMKHTERNENMFQLETVFCGSIPSSLFTLFIVSFYKTNLLQRPNTFLEVYEDSLKVTINRSNIAIHFENTEEEDRVVIFLECSINESDEIFFVWSIWKNCCEILTDLTETWWPELFYDAYLICSHCILTKKAVIRHVSIEMVGKCCIDKFVSCYGQDPIPAALIHPPSKYTFV